MLIIPAKYEINSRRVTLNMLMNDLRVFSGTIPVDQEHASVIATINETMVILEAAQI